MHSRLLKLQLPIRTLDMPLICRHPLPHIRPDLHTAGTAIITCPVMDVYIIDHRLIIVRIMHDRRIHIRNGRVVYKPPATPLATAIPCTHIPTTVVDTAIISDMRTPIPRVPKINVIGPTPITGRP